MPVDLRNVLVSLANDAALTATCPIAQLARDLWQLDGATPAEVASARLAAAQREASAVELKLEQCKIAHDKLTAELQRVDALSDDLKRQATKLRETEALCRGVINASYTEDQSGAPSQTAVQDSAPQTQAPVSTEPARPGRDSDAFARDEQRPATTTPPPQATRADDDLHDDRQKGAGPSSQQTAAPERSNAPRDAYADEPRSSDAHRDETTAASQRSSSGTVRFQDPVLAAAAAVISAGDDVKESAVLHALGRLESAASAAEAEGWSSDSRAPGQFAEWRAMTGMLWAHVPHPRPPVQSLEARVLASVFRRARPAPPVEGEPHLFDTATPDGCADALRALIQSVNDDVKVDGMDLLAVLLADEQLRDELISADIIPIVTHVVAVSTSEPVLERALIALWTLAGSNTAKTLIREANGLNAVLELLYTDSFPILDNVGMALGFLTRDEQNKVEMRTIGGLEKLVASLIHPSPAIQTKIAGAIWNCASNKENRERLRQLGVVPLLIELLQVEAVQENAAGALWNLAVDAESKAAILEYGGLPPLVALLTSESDAVVENATGTLWNCSSTLDTRAALRKFGALPKIVSLLRSSHPRIQDNAAGALRNLVINDQNKAAIREAGGIDLIVDLVDSAAPAVLDKLVSTLWILSVTPENKHALRTAGGLPKLVRILGDTRDGSLVEKVLGTIRNCSSVAENRAPLIELGALDVLVRVARQAEVGVAGSRATKQLRENIAGTLWNLGRDDKTTPVRAGAMPLLVSLLSDPDDTVKEQAVGGLATLVSNTPENRDLLRTVGGLQALIDIMLKTSHPYVQQHVLHAVKHATTLHEGNQRFVAADKHVVPRLLELVQSPPTANVSSASCSEDIVREAMFCLRNLTSDKSAADTIIDCGGPAALQRVADAARSDTIKKAAAMVLQLLSRHSRAR